MDALKSLATDSSFLASVILLFLGAALTGLLLPVVKARLDNTSAERKLLLEAELARQTEFLRAQTDLLASFSDATWAFLFDAFKVSYAEAWEEEEAQVEAWDSYTPLSWTHLGRVRAIVSKSKRLIADDSHRRLLTTYEWLLEYDDALAAFNKEEHGAEDWQEFHKVRFREAALRMDHAIESLANELRLSAGSELRPLGRGRQSRTLAASVGGST